MHDIETHSKGIASSLTDLLTTLIAIVCHAIEPLMLILDVILLLANQSKFVCFMEQMASIDRKLLRENISVHYGFMQYFSVYLICINFGKAVVSCAYVYVQFHINFPRRLILLTPILISNLFKIWFIVLSTNIRLKFSAIATFLVVAETKLKRAKRIRIIRLYEERGIIDNLHSQILPDCEINEKEFISETLKTVDRLCKIHDEICESLKLINDIFGLSMFVLMFYVFMYTTVHLYFMYYNYTGQDIPEYFKLAKNTPLEISVFLSTFFTCTNAAHSYWKMKCYSNRLVINIHRIGDSINNEMAYRKVSLIIHSR